MGIGVSTNTKTRSLAMVGVIVTEHPEDNINLQPKPCIFWSIRVNELPFLCKDCINLFGICLLQTCYLPHAQMECEDTVATRTKFKISTNL